MEYYNPREGNYDMYEMDLEAWIKQFVIQERILPTDREIQDFGYFWDKEYMENL